MDSHGLPGSASKDLNGAHHLGRVKENPENRNVNAGVTDK